MKQLSIPYSPPTTINRSTESMASPIAPFTALLRIWVSPRQTLQGLAAAAGWSWVIPIGLALLGFYGHLFVATLFGAPPRDIVMVAGVLAILLG